MSSVDVSSLLAEIQRLEGRFKTILAVERNAVDTHVMGVYVSAKTLEAAVACLALCATVLQSQTWQPIETAPKDGTPFFVYWSKSLMGDPTSDKVSGWDEYQEILGYGEPPATHWMAAAPPLPRSPGDK